MVLTMVWSGNGLSEDAPYLIEPREAGVEVLLNGPGLEFDLSVLDGLIKDGKVKVPVYPNQSQIGGLTESPLQGPYLMRSSHDPRLGLVIAPEDQTEFLSSQGIDNPMKGISVSILVPGQTVMVKWNITVYDLFINMTFLYDESTREGLMDIGFTDIRPQGGSEPSVVEFRYGGTKFFLMDETLEIDGGQTDVVHIMIEVQEGDMNEDLKGRIGSLIELLGGSPTLWDNASKGEFSMLNPMVSIPPDLDPDLIDWVTAMRSQLEHLIEIGLITGLVEDDISSISGQCSKGTFGFGNRVFFHNATNSWRRYNGTGFPSPVGLPGSGYTIYSDEMFPDGGGAPVPNKLILPLVIVAAFLIFVILGSLLFQRFDRASKLNNARRLLIYNTIKQSPGIHFSALMKDLGLKPGVTSYHINRLEKEELIKSFQDGMYRRFYLYEDKVETKLMLSDLQKLILETIKAEPGISQMGISKVVGRSKVVINYHIRFLRDLGVLTVEAEGRETHCFLTSQGIMLSAA
jgi:predicted transcriptional regulator